MSDSYIVLQVGDLIRFFHKEMEAYLVAEGLFDDELTEDGMWNSHYTPGIYAEGYIVFFFPFVCSFVRTSITFVEFASKFCVKVSQVVYISATTYQKAFIFGL